METIKTFVENLITNFGYLGIYIGMFIESASIPLPSEIIMGVAGYLVFKGEMNLWLAGFIGALGNISGSTVMYFLGLKGGRPFAEKYGKYIHLTEKSWEKSDRLFAKWGDEMVFIAQLMPGVRTFISFPAGLLKVNFPKFIAYTFLGAFIWCLSLAFAAYKLGENWGKIEDFIREYQVIILGLILVAILTGAVYLWYRKFVLGTNHASRK